MFEKLNEKVGKLTYIDVQLIKLATFFATIIIVKLFSQLLRINYWVLIVLTIACSVKPVYKFLTRK